MGAEPLNAGANVVTTSLAECVVMQQAARIVEHTQLCSNIWLVCVEAPRIAASIKPGQFVHMHIPHMEAHVLRRPFSVFYVNEEQTQLAIMYQVVGFGTKHLTTLLPGEVLDLIGPVGHGWQMPTSKGRALLVAGGLGAAPLYMHAQQLRAAGIEVDVVLGAQTASALVSEPYYTTLLGSEPFLATDDGTRGFAGFCTGVVQQCVAQTAYSYAACCGPEPMMRTTSALTLQAGIPTAISLEKRMACGIGACLSCVVETVEGRKRSCVDGPVFDAAKVVW